jgi:hypothetical protein
MANFALFAFHISAALNWISVIKLLPFSISHYFDFFLHL